MGTPGSPPPQPASSDLQALLPTGTKKKRNRKRKNKEGKLTAEEMYQMPTDDLCNYIENKAATENALNMSAGGSIMGQPN